jgi:hypothetical protein
VAVSRDDGATWQNVYLSGCRIHAMLTVSGRVYATDMVAGPRWQEAWHNWAIEAGRPELVHSNVYEFDGVDGFEPRPDLTAPALFPETESVGRQESKLVKPVCFGSKATYIGGCCHNDHQFLPFGLFAANSLEEGAVDVRRLELPADGRPWDLIVRDGRLYVLLGSPVDDGHLVRVLASDDLEDWTELLRFHASTFARSFEYLDGYWYFGLGCEVADPENWTVEELHPDTGVILGVRETPRAAAAQE